MRSSNRQRIIDASVQLAARDGMRGVTIESVAAAVGVTKGGVQYHFQTKDDLLEAVVADVWRQFDAEALATLDKPFDEATRAERLRAFIESAIGGADRAGELAFLLDPGAIDVHEHSRRFARRWLESDAEPLTARQRVALYAADGIWLQDASALRSTTGEDRTAVLAELLALAGV